MFPRLTVGYFSFCLLSFLFVVLCCSSCKKSHLIADTDNIVPDPIFKQKITGNIHAIVDDSYNWKFAEALKEIESLRDKEDVFLLDLLTVGTLFWQYIAAVTPEENESAKKAFTNITNKIKVEAEGILSKEPDNLKALYLLGFAEGSQSKFYAIEGEFFKAYRYGVRGYNRLRKIEKVNPSDYDTQFGIGLYKYYCATLLPRWFRNLSFLVPGIDVDREGGYQRVFLASKYGTFMRTEADLTLAQGNASYEREYKKGVDISEKIVKEYPKNKVFAYTHNVSSYYLSMHKYYEGKLEQAIKIMRQVIKVANDNPQFRLRIRKKSYLTPILRWKLDAPAEHEVLYSLYRDLGRLYAYNDNRELADRTLLEGATRVALTKDIRAALYFELGRQYQLLNLPNANQYFQLAFDTAGEGSEIASHCKTVMTASYIVPEIERKIWDMYVRIGRGKVTLQNVLDLRKQYSKAEYSGYIFEFYEMMFHFYDMAGDHKMSEKYHDEVRVHQQLDR